MNRVSRRPACTGLPLQAPEPRFVGSGMLLRASRERPSARGSPVLRLVTDLSALRASSRAPAALFDYPCQLSAHDLDDPCQFNGKPLHALHASISAAPGRRRKRARTSKTEL